MDQFNSAWDSIPLWLALPLLVVFVAGCLEGGFRIGRWRRANAVDERESAVGALSTATIGLLGFMLAFTFGIAVSRFEGRLQTVLDESNAIGTSYLRAGFLPPPQSERARALLRDYVDHRITPTHATDHASRIERSEQIHTTLWNQATEAALANPGSLPISLYVDSLNTLIDLHSKRVQVGLHMRIPPIVWIVLLSLTGVGMWSVGYYLGISERSRSLLLIALSLSFSAVLYLVADLDRPGEGSLRTGQWSLMELKRSFAKDAAVTAPSPRPEPRAP